MREKLETLSLAVLKDFAKDKKIKNASTMRKKELIDAIISASEQERDNAKETSKESYAGDLESKEKAAVSDERPEQKNQEMADGILEVLSDGYGFIRCENFLPGENDVYVSPSQIRKFNLKTGDIVRGPKRAKSQGEKFSALMYLEQINDLDPVLANKETVI